MSPTLVKCGCCGCDIRRKEHPEGGKLPEVWTRTLVKGEFLPSCSESCAVRLRMMIGDRKRVA